MGKRFHAQDAEREANEIGLRFQNSGNVMQDMSRAYHVDFSNIRVHTDEAADRRVKAAGKDALAKGSDVFFGKGIFESSDPAAKGLVAHELAHTMQQGAAGGGETAVAEMAPMGAEQGGLIDWFRKKFGKKKQGITMLGDWQRMTDEASMAHMGRQQEIGDEARRRAFTDAYDAAGADAARSTGLSQDMKDRIKAVSKDSVKASDAITEQNAGLNWASQAVVSLGHRNNGTSAGTVDFDARRQEVFNGSDDVYRKYITARAANGEDTSAYLAGQQGYKQGGKDHVISPEIAKTTGDLMAIMGQYLTSDTGLDYIDATTKQVQSANVFHNSAYTPLNFILTSAFTGENGRVGGQMAKMMLDQSNPALQEHIMTATRNMMNVPLMDRMTEQERAAMPADLQPLYVQFVALKEEIERRLAARNG